MCGGGAGATCHSGGDAGGEYRSEHAGLLQTKRAAGRQASKRSKRHAILVKRTRGVVIQASQVCGLTVSKTPQEGQEVDAPFALRARAVRFIDGRALSLVDHIARREAEPTAEFAVVAYEDWNVQGAAERATDEYRGRFVGDVDRLIHRRDFSDRDPAVSRI